MTSILACDGVYAFQGLEGAKADVAQVADRRRDEIQSSHDLRVYRATKIVYEGRGRYTAGVGIVVAVVVGAVLLALAFLGLGRLRSSGLRRRLGSADGDSPHDRRPGSVRPGACPLCSTPLGPGERVKSDIYPGKGDRMMRIFGCPRCLPPTGNFPRVCPVCLRVLPPEGWVVARYFERPGRRHVHVLGCTACRPVGGEAGRNRM